MKTVLILGHGGDLCCHGVRDELLDRGCRVIHLPEDRLLPGIGLAWEVQGRSLRGSVRFEGQEADFDEIDGVLVRSMGVPVAPEAYDSVDGRYVSSEWNAMVMAWASAMPCTVVNRVRPELWYRSSLNVQALAALAPDMPFRRPSAMVTTRVEDARDFQSRRGGRVRYEPLTQRVGYRVDGEEGLGRLSRLTGTLPLQLIEVVDGDQFGAFVVSDRVVMTDFHGSLVTPEDTVEEDAVSVARSLGLAFCRLELAREDDDTWSCSAVDRLPHLYDCTPETRSLIAGLLADALLDRAGAGEVRP